MSKIIKASTPLGFNPEQSRRVKFEYAANWHLTCRRTHKLQTKCTNNPLHGDAQIVHHLKYKIGFLRRTWYAAKLVFHCCMGIATLLINRKAAIKHFEQVSMPVGAQHCCALASVLVLSFSRFSFPYSVW